MNTSGVVDHITNWLSDYAQKSGTTGFVIGVSGGIDSAITSTLGARTGLDMLCLEMPIHQETLQVGRAFDHITWLKSQYSNVRSAKVELTSVYDTLVDELGCDPKSPGHDMALVNTRARLRMTTLYYHAAANNLLVLGTGNKVEDFGVGFYTKYGDGGVDISPIADLTKTEVYAVGKKLGISDDIMVAPPTDGLWGDDRTDEDQLGASYPELEWAMATMTHGGVMSHDGESSGDESDFTDRQQEVLKIYQRLNTANKHKMDPIPVCIIPDNLK